MTRAEAAAIFARLISEKKGEKISETKTGFSDIKSNGWYTSYISYLEKYGIIKGYSDNTFRPDNNITRAEVVTVVNHATGRYADKEYINDNLSVLNKFTDLKNNSHWGYYEIMEAANTHEAVINSYTETWVK